MAVLVTVAWNDIFDGVRDAVCERLRAFLDLVCASLSCVPKIVCAFAYVLGD